MTLALTSRPKMWFLEDKEGVAAWGHLGSKHETASLDGRDRDKRAVAFFFFFFLHTPLFVLYQAGSKKPHRAQAIALLCQGSEKKTSRHDESSPCFLLYLNPAQPISLTCSSLSSSARFTYPDANTAVEAATTHALSVLAPLNLLLWWSCRRSWSHHWRAIKWV